MTSNCDVNFSSPLKPPTLSTSALTNISAVLIIGAPAAARSAHHTERRGSQLTCSSTAACSRASNPVKQPIILDRSRLSCPPRPSRKRQAERASHKQISKQRANESKGSRRLPGCRPQQAFLNAFRSAAKHGQRRQAAQTFQCLRRLHQSACDQGFPAGRFG